MCDILSGTTSGTRLTGLNPTEVEESRKRYGINILTPPPKPSLWSRFIDYFRNPLIEILLVALLLSIGISCYEYTLPSHDFEVFLEPLGILIAILLATVIGFALEVNANKKFEILNQVNDDILVKVIREGHVTRIPRKDVVVGDVVIIETGDEIPADGDLVDSVALSVNESTLTGEPLVRKSHRPEDAEHDVTYSTSRVMRGTTVAEGHGEMVVTAVGDSTEYGKVYEAAQIDTGVKTPLTLQFERLGRVISIGSYAVGALIVIGRLLVFPWGDADTVSIIDYLLTTIMLAVTLIVVSVPEGLPMSVTLSLALSMRRMLANNNLVRKMHACETMGATTVICTDKTGTLTRNQMRVYRADFFALPDGNKLDDDMMSRIVEEGIAVNSTAFLETGDDPSKTTAIGNPTEGALLLWLYDKGIDYLRLRENAAVISQLPFSTERKYMATVVESPFTGSRMLYVKGAPEIVLGLSSDIAGEATADSITSQLLGYQRQAMRTLGFAYARLNDDEEPIVDGKLTCDRLTFIGVAAISDPVRDDVPAAISECLDAGISIKIVTGDTPGTAREIGRQVGLWREGDDDDSLISGPDFAALTDDEARRRVERLKIMSRARPSDKSRLVRLLQENGEVVAVTGDGTNDAPALNAAQVGLSMGDGTSVAKEASDITIMDNSLASITKAVMWGRSLYQNIQRFILFQLTVNLVACLTVVIGAFTGTESPLTVTQMLWVNLIMDTFAALALASLPPSMEVMRHRPRRSSDFIINRRMTWDIFGTGFLFIVLLFGIMQYFRHYDITSLTQFDPAAFISAFVNFSPTHMASLSPYDLSMFFTIFVFLQFWNLFNARAFESGHTAFHDMRDSKVFFLTLAIIAAGQWIIIEIGGPMFNVVPLKTADWLIIICSTSLIMIVPMVIALFRKKD
ncbi:MAG: calcium-translocating P-type ATPase, PMCA-type [Pseudoflavonifractor sp.]|nr:calcium-translocating P-type ATPase, PMCA-type [Pseudoflavonifractor sp.]